MIPGACCTIRLAARFSEPVTGFEPRRRLLRGHTGGGSLVAAVSGGPSVYSVAVTGMTTAGTVVAGVPAGAASDSAGNPSTASTGTDDTVVFDATAPTASPTRDPAADVNGWNKGRRDGDLELGR